nr:DUF2071 domain-containing protein [Ornithinimicrobium sp. F0845]
MTDLQRDELETIRGADAYRFHGLLDYDQLAIVCHWDFPSSIIGPILSAERDLPAPSLKSLLPTSRTDTPTGMSARHPSHRVRVPVNLQTWSHLTFLHWEYAVETVQELVPERLRVQAWDGRTWVGVIPFAMSDVRAPGLPPPPGWGYFPELNVRAYVRSADGREGIWFLTMLVPRVTFQAALSTIGLPYHRSDCTIRVMGDRWTRDRILGDPAASDRVTCARWDYRFGEPALTRPPADDWFRARVDVGPPLAEADRTPLVDSLTARWWAFHRRGILWHAPANHPPGPLHEASVTGRLTAPLRHAGLPEPLGPPMIHASPGVRTKLGSLRPA